MSFLLLLPQLSVLAIGSPVEEGQDAITVEKPEDLAPVSTKQLVDLHNKLVPSAPVKKFKDRVTANDRLFKLLGSAAGKPEGASSDDDPWNMANAPESPEKGKGATATDTSPDAEDTSTKEDTVAATATKKRGAKKGAKGPATKGAKRGRAPGYTGARLTRVGEENPCRTGGLRAQSWDLIPKGGISFEKYIEKGGRTQELAFNVRQGRVKVEYPKGNGKGE